MRIIAGERRGAKLEAVDGLTTRPTADRVKEGLFNVLQMDIDESTTVLDVFAGTGNLGLEALSRGAKSVVFIEKDPRAVAVLRRNVKKCRYEDRCKIIEGDARNVLPKLSASFDLIFVDPPYKMGLYEPVFFSILQYHLLTDYGILVSEHAKTMAFSFESEEIQHYKSKSYGDTTLHFFRYYQVNERES